MQKCILASLIIKEGFYIANAPGVFPEAFLEVPSGPFKPNNIYLYLSR